LLLLLLLMGDGSNRTDNRFLTDMVIVYRTADMLVIDTMHHDIIDICGEKCNIESLTMIETVNKEAQHHRTRDN
jgi:hypothetical protein